MSTNNILDKLMIGMINMLIWIVLKLSPPEALGQGIMRLYPYLLRLYFHVKYGYNIYSAMYVYGKANIATKSLDALKDKLVRDIFKHVLKDRTKRVTLKDGLLRKAHVAILEEYFWSVVVGK